MGLPQWLSNKELTWSAENQVWSLGQENTPEKEMVAHSNILAWEIPRTEEPVRLQPVGSQTVWPHWVTKQQQQERYKCMSVSQGSGVRQTPANRETTLLSIPDRRGMGNECPWPFLGEKTQWRTGNPLWSQQPQLHSSIHSVSQSSFVHGFSLWDFLLQNTPRNPEDKPFNHAFSFSVITETMSQQTCKGI